MGFLNVFAASPTPRPPIPVPTQENLKDVLCMTYEEKMVPMEKQHIFDQFYTPSLYKAEFNAKPMVLFLGQYSVGKTTMIKYLLNGKEYPGAMIGPEPTTDCFTVIYHSLNTGTIMGTSLVTDRDLPFQSLNMFGSGFLTKMRGATLPSPVLDHITLIDTPGILSGQKQTTTRGYDFASVVNYIATKVDMIILLFDTSKLDISDEYKQVILCLKGNEEKIKIVLNKADQVGAPELIRVRGALMWSLSKILLTPEVPKVYIGSFWENEEKKRTEVHELFQEEYDQFFDEIKMLPQLCSVRKLNDVIKRAKKLKIHAMVMEKLLKLMWMKSDKEIRRVVTPSNLEKIYADFKNRLRMADCDMPEIPMFIAKARESYAKAWNKVDLKMMALLDDFINNDVPGMMSVVNVKEVKVPNELEEAFKKVLVNV